MNIRQLVFFCRAASAGSFSAAAQAEGVTVQAVSKSIHELEDEVGGRLFVRSGRGMRLTQLGGALLEPALKTVESFDSVEQTAASWQGATKREGLRLALVTPPFSKHEFICGVISRLITRSLGVETRLTVSVGRDALTGLRAGILDALFTIGGLDAPGCTCVQVGMLMPGVFMGRRHPLRGKHPLTFADLEPYPVLWSEEIDGFNETILNSCLRHGLASPLESISTSEEVVDFLENRNGYIMGVNLKELSIVPFAMMHGIDPAEAPAVPVCLVTLDEPQRPEVERLNQFARSEFSLMKRLFNSDKAAVGC